MPEKGQYVECHGKVGVVEMVFDDFFIMDSEEWGLTIVTWMDPWKLY